MNDLYLIGNGFDLAHGLETSYNHFLLWYLNDFLKNFWQKDHFEDELMTIDRMGARWHFPDKFDTIPNLIQFLEQYQYKRKAKCDFFEKIIKNYRDYKWVDIEYEYYMALVNFYKKLNKVEDINEGTDIEKQKKEKEKEQIAKSLEDLNNCFTFILNKLEEYLDFARKKPFDKIMQIEEILFEEAGTPETREIEYFKEISEKNSEKFIEEKLFVSFNYTATMESYLRNSKHEKNLIYIHGELNDPSNPVIFGYGDEMDPHYEKIENLNNNEFLKNIKSFNYFKTDNYQKVIRFIEGVDREYTVKVLGHSCGLSDRILLNTIFEHPNCIAIKIYYYQKSETENDYFEKTQEISRHFKASMKGEMRKKIVPFEQSIPLPQNPKDN